MRASRLVHSALTIASVSALLSGCEPQANAEAAFEQSLQPVAATTDAGDCRYTVVETSAMQTASEIDRDENSQHALILQAKYIVDCQWMMQDSHSQGSVPSVEHFADSNLLQNNLPKISM